jgi:hypothetical protein
MAMNREEFEYLRDMSGKRITDEIKLAPKRRNSPVLASEAIPIENERDVPANLNIEYNTQTDAKTVNVSVPGIGPICRLEVDARAHRPYGRSHKHALSSELCPYENLKRDIIDKSELSGMDIRLKTQSGH